MKTASHRISIPSLLEVGKGNLLQLGSLLKKNNLDHVGLYYGEGIQELFGSSVEASINDAGIEIADLDTISSIDLHDISDKAFQIRKDIEVLIGIGGGKVIDGVKYMGFLRKLPFISVPTSTSNDGFSSSGASLLVQGKRLSVPAKTPYGIVVDIDVIKSAPPKFIYSGIGDLLSNITALYDWKFEEEQNACRVDDFAMMISKKAVNSFVRTEFNSIRDDLFLKELVDSLAMNGIAMEIAGNSSPASGAEHLISHALDTFVEVPQLHGIQVGLSTYIMSRVQQHRTPRITKVLEQTGFFDYAQTLGMKKADFQRAIELAPSMKPSRKTFLHVPENIDKAIQILNEDALLSRILI